MSKSVKNTFSQQDKTAYFWAGHFNGFDSSDIGQDIGNAQIRKKLLVQHNISPTLQWNNWLNVGGTKGPLKSNKFNFWSPCWGCKGDLKRTSKPELKYQQKWLYDFRETLTKESSEIII